MYLRSCCQGKDGGVSCGELLLETRRGSCSTMEKQKTLAGCWRAEHFHTIARPTRIRKVLFSVLWDEGVAYHEVLQPAKTVTAAVYCSHRMKLAEALRQKRSKFWSNRSEVLLSHDNERRRIVMVNQTRSSS
ncbi:hypothetical protein M514_08639, partial [Trichuris suis]